MTRITQGVHAEGAKYGVHAGTKIGCLLNTDLSLQLSWISDELLVARIAGKSVVMDRAAIRMLMEEVTRRG